MSDEGSRGEGTADRAQTLQLEKVKLWYDSLLQNNPDGIIEADETGYIIAVNPALERMIGFSSDELCRRPLLDLASSEDTTWADSVRLSTHGHVIAGESALRRRCGNSIHVQHKFVPVLIDTQVAGVHVIVKDITEDKRAKAELLLTKEQLQTIFDTLDISLWSQEYPSRTMTYVSPGSEKVWGIPRNELESDSHAPYRLIHPDDVHTIRERAQEVFEGIPVVQDFRIVKSDEEVRWIHDEVTPTLDEHGNLLRLSGVAVDITELKLAEDERARTREMLRRSEQLSAVGQLAAGIAHEIRNPLTSVMGFMQLIKPMIPERMEYVDIMMSELTRIGEIISEFLVLAKPQDMKMEAQDLRSILEEITSFFHSQAVMQNIAFVLNIHPFLPRIFCDKNQMKQIFINLIKNAMEAMPLGGTITISATIHTDNTVFMCIADEGSGINSEILTKVGQPFFTTKEGGTGLGMMVTRQLIENHGGTMSIESETGKGTSISVTLPAAENQTEAS